MRRIGNEDGFAVVAAVVLLTVIMGLGLGLLLFADSQQKASTRQQSSEAAFNVAEAALNAQVGQLSREWPTEKSAGTNPLPSSCTASTSTEKTNACPSSTDLKLDPNTSSTTCSGTDAWGAPLSNQWTTYVRQDVSEGSGASAHESSLFNSTTEQSQPSYATSEAGSLWVRAVGVVQCHPVTVVTLVTRQRVALNFPQDAIAGNWFKTTNNGRKVIVDRKGRAVESGQVGMRCEPPRSRASGTCEEYEVAKEQVSPPISEHPVTPATTLTAGELAILKAEAQAHATFYSATSPYHCPSSMTELQGVTLSSTTRAPVYVEGCGELNVKANGTANTEANPGFLVIANGTFEISGTATYYGIIYGANLQKSSGAVVKLQGNSNVVGGIIVDSTGGIEFGSSGENLEFDSLAFHNLTISAGAAATRNSFRVLPAGQ
jgi:Tfp pilus assembly protein PilX